jgi:hypothetical protein
MIIWWYVYFYGSYGLNWTLNPFMIGYEESGNFTFKGKAWYAIKYNFPWYMVYLGSFILFMGFLYLTGSGNELLKSGGGYLGVMIGLNLAFSLLWLAGVLGYGVVKIPLATFKYSNLEQRLDYYRYKAAFHDDKLYAVVSEKSQNLQQLIFCVKDIRVKPDHAGYKAQVLQNVDYALAKADANQIRLRTGSYLDCNPKLTNTYNSGELTYEKLVNLNKKLKDETTDMLRQSAFKKESIRQAIICEDILNSKRQV